MSGTEPDTPEGQDHRLPPVNIEGAPGQPAPRRRGVLVTLAGAGAAALLLALGLRWLWGR